MIFLIFKMRPELYTGQEDIARGIELIIGDAEERGDFKPSLLSRGASILTPAEFANLYFFEGRCYYCADETRKVVGVIGYHETLPEKFVGRGIVEDKNEPYLHTMIVEPHKRGSGVATELVSICSRDALSRSKITMVARTWIHDDASKSNTASIKTLTRSGFVEFHRDSNCPDRPQGYGSVYLRKTL